jgi:hypothetical protein
LSDRPPFQTSESCPSPYFQDFYPKSLFCKILYITPLDVRFCGESKNIIVCFQYFADNFEEGVFSVEGRLSTSGSRSKELRFLPLTHRFAALPNSSEALAKSGTRRAKRAGAFRAC